MDSSHYVLKLSCPDRKGIVNAVSAFLLAQDFNILDSAQSGDLNNGQFFMRVSFQAAQERNLGQVAAEFAPVSQEFQMQSSFHGAADKTRVILMVSKLGHCLNDLLYRYTTGILPIEIVAVVSNHRDFYQLTASHDIPFHHWPVTPRSKAQQEQRLLELYDQERADLIVLARYMQVLSEETCARLPERIINIHHSFLPSFKGARPYHQAYERGVKLIGATAHFVTSDLDEGPIIEQDIVRVDHDDAVEHFIAAGREVECAVLARALGWYSEHRVILNGKRTVVFR